MGLHDVGRPTVQAPRKALVTVITSTKPLIVSKVYWLTETGLQKRTSGNLSAGSITVVEVDSLESFANLLAGLRTDQLLTYGVPPVSTAGLTTVDDWHRRGCPSDRLPRTKEVFEFRKDVPGILMLDYDPARGGQPLSCAQLVTRLRTAVPGLRRARMLYLPSSSSHICHGEQDLTGLRGQRLYILVADAADIPRAGKAIVDALWAAGQGHFEVSKAGSLLPRTLFDATVFSPEREDFAAGAVCEPPLEQRRGAPVMISAEDGHEEPFDTAAGIPGNQVEAARAAQAAARKDPELLARQHAIREQYIGGRIDELLPVALNRDDPVAVAQATEHARKTILHALDGGVLSGDMPVTVLNGGHATDVTVGTILDDRNRYHGRLTLEPLERDYDGGRPVGKLFLWGAVPVLHSMAHGGRTFRLSRAPRRLQLVPGQTHVLVDQVLEGLRQPCEFFDFEGSMVAVCEDGTIARLSVPALRHLLAAHFSFYSVQMTPQKQPFERDADPPEKLCESVLALPASVRRLRRLRAVITAPVMRLDGTLLVEPGYDSETGLLLSPTDHLPAIPDRPGIEQVRAALSELWGPFNGFGFVGAADRGAYLAGLLTAAIRPVLPFTPAFSFDAATQGEGKTMLGRCLATLDGGPGTTTAPTDDPEEMRKLLMAAAVAGRRVMIIDNVMGTLHGAALAQAVTSEWLEGRLLGKSEMVAAPNVLLIVVTGNNLQMGADLVRRFIVARLDSGVEAPYRRQFDFDPVAMVRTHRHRYVAAALTILRGWLTHGRPTAASRSSDFPDWSRLVRGAVEWIGETIDARFADPMQTVERQAAANPELEDHAELIDAWVAVFDSQAVSAEEVARRVRVEPLTGSVSAEARLGEALRGLVHGQLTARSIGNVLRHRRDRLIDGRKFVGQLDRKGVTRWRVEITPTRCENGAKPARVPGLPSLPGHHTLRGESPYNGEHPIGVFEPGRPGRPGNPPDDTGIERTAFAERL